jgi:hypothetical protein
MSNSHNHQIKGGARKVSVASIEQIGITTSPLLLTANPLDALRKIYRTSCAHEYFQLTLGEMRSLEVER